MTRHAHDVVIVGGGPSAMGLLLGLLERIPLDEKKRVPYTIAVIDRGEHNDRRETRPVQRWYSAAHKTSSCSEVLSSVPQKGLMDRIIDVPTGKSLGGGTNINACLVTQPSEDDFDSWPGRWRGGKVILDAYDRLLKRMEASAPLEVVEMREEYRRHCCNDEKLEKDSQECKSLREAVHRTGMFPALVSSVPMAICRNEQCPKLKNITEYRRVNCYELLVQHLLDERPDLVHRVVRFYNGVHVQRIAMEDGRATGVTCTKMETIGNKTTIREFDIHATREVVVCCGAIYSPSLLLVSGIGNATQLGELGIDPCPNQDDVTSKGKQRLLNLDVGRKLHDHVLVPRLFMSLRSPRRTERPISCIKGIHNIEIAPLPSTQSAQTHQNPDHLKQPRLQLLLLDGSLHSQVLPLFLSSQFGKNFDHVDATTGRRRLFVATDKFLRSTLVALLKLLLVLVFEYSPVGYVLDHYTFGYNICLLKPRSSGNVTLKRKRGREKDTKSSDLRLCDFDVVIDPGYCSNRQDVDALISGFEATDVLRRHWFREDCGFAEISPGWLFRTLFPFLSGYNGFDVDEQGSDKQVGAKEWLRRYIALFACPYFHWCGTCAMGEESVDKSQSQHESSNMVGSHVVNDALQVRGIEGLRVCDASVFPTCISGPTSLTCAALGYAAAPLVVKDITGKTQ